MQAILRMMTAEFRLEIGNSFDSISDIENLVIKGHEQDMLRLERYCHM